MVRSPSMLADATQISPTLGATDTTLTPIVMDTLHALVSDTLRLTRVDTVFVVLRPESWSAHVAEQLAIWVPILIAVTALWFSIRHGRQMIGHNKIVTEPHLTVVRCLGTDPGKLVGFGITNEGFGPAIIRRYDMRIGNKSFDLCTLAIYDAAREADLLGRGVNTSGMEAGERMLNGKNVWNFSATPQSNDEARALSERICRLSAVVNYESVYGEKYTLNIDAANWDEIVNRGTRAR